MVTVDVRMCDEGGHWSGQAPLCSPINCGYPEKLENADYTLLNGSTVLGSLVAFKCMDSFVFNNTLDRARGQNFNTLSLHFTNGL